MSSRYEKVGRLVWDGVTLASLLGLGLTVLVHGDTIKSRLITRCVVISTVSPDSSLLLVTRRNPGSCPG